MCSWTQIKKRHTCRIDVSIVRHKERFQHELPSCLSLLLWLSLSLSLSLYLVQPAVDVFVNARAVLCSVVTGIFFFFCKSPVITQLFDIHFLCSSILLQSTEGWLHVVVQPFLETRRAVSIQVLSQEWISTQHCILLHQFTAWQPPQQHMVPGHGPGRWAHISIRYMQPPTSQHTHRNMEASVHMLTQEERRQHVEAHCRLMLVSTIYLVLFMRFKCMQSD